MTPQDDTPDAEHEDGGEELAEPYSEFIEVSISDEGTTFRIDDPTVLEIVGLLIFVAALLIWVTRHRRGVRPDREGHRGGLGPPPPRPRRRP